MGVLLVQSEFAPQLLHALFKAHEGLAETLDLVGGQRAALDSPHRLALHDLADEVDEHQHQAGEALLDVLGIGVDPAAQRGAEALLELAHSAAKL
jgi:hypothetical protein